MEHSVAQIPEGVRLPPDPGPVDADRAAADAVGVGAERPGEQRGDVLGVGEVAALLH